MPKKLAELVKELKEDVKESIAKIKALKPDGEKWKISTFIGALPKISGMIEELIIKVEKISKEAQAISGKEKQEAVVTVINSCVDVPKVPEWVEQILFRFAINCIIKLYNKKFGKGVGSEPGADWVEEPNFVCLSVR